jgi:hypothetical protein
MNIRKKVVDMVLGFSYSKSINHLLRRNKVNTEITKPSVLDSFKLYYEELPGWKLLTQPLINLTKRKKKAKK